MINQFYNTKLKDIENEKIFIGDTLMNRQIEGHGKVIFEDNKVKIIIKKEKFILTNELIKELNLKIIRGKR